MALYLVAHNTIGLRQRRPVSLQRGQRRVVAVTPDGHQLVGILDAGPAALKPAPALPLAARLLEHGLAVRREVHGAHTDRMGVPSYLAEVRLKRVAP